MNSEEVAVKLESHENEIGSLKHRMNKAEEVIKSIYDLNTNVATLVVTVKSTDDKVTKLSEEVGEIKKKPGEAFDKIKIIIATAVISGTIGIIITALVNAIKAV